MIAPVCNIIASLFQAFRERSASTPRCFSCSHLSAPSHDLNAWNGLGTPRNFEEVSCEWSWQRTSACGASAYFFSGEQKLSVYCVLSPSLILNVAPILCRQEGIPLPKNCCAIGILACITGGIWKKIPYSRPNSLISIPYSRVNCVKTIPFTAAHAYRAHILPLPRKI